MDTKWKKYKYSSLNKALCVLLACFMAAVLMSNGLSLIRYCVFFGNEKNFLNPEKNNFYTSAAFENNFLEDISSVENVITNSARVQQKRDYIDSFFANYKQAERENRLSDAEVLSIVYGEEDVMNRRTAIINQDI